MADTVQNNANPVSLVDRLNSTDKYLAEMRNVLASMDEIDEVRRKRGEPITDEYGGYKRSSVTKMVTGLERQRESILNSIRAEEQKRAALEARQEAERKAREAQRLKQEQEAKARAEREAREKAERDRQQQNERLAAMERSLQVSEERRLAEIKKQEEESNSTNPLVQFRRGDASLVLESMYDSLAMDIEKIRDDVLQEMKYAYKQDMAIYDDLTSLIESTKKENQESMEAAVGTLSEKLDSISRVDYDQIADTVAEKITPVDYGQIADTVAEKITPVDYDQIADTVAEKITPVDYGQLADNVAEKLVTGIDYDTLARHIVDIMGAQQPQPEALPAPEPAPAPENLESMERKIDDLQSILQGAVSVKQMPEFKRLDSLISDYLQSGSYDLIPDILIAADAAKNLACRYIVSGNTLRGETMLSDIRMRLSRVIVSGSDALLAVSDAIATHGLPVVYPAEALEGYRNACIEFEQSSAVPQDEPTTSLLLAKKALFNDKDMEEQDTQTMEEVLHLRESLGGEQPDAEQVDTFQKYKKDLMAFDLSPFIDLTAPLPGETAPGSAADTQAILDAIAELKRGQQVYVVPVQESAESGEPKGEVKMAQTVPYRPVTPKKKRPLRPAVSSKDNVVAKTEQPLRTVKRKIDVSSGKNSDEISQKVADDLASRLAKNTTK